MDGWFARPHSHLEWLGGGLLAFTDWDWELFQRLLCLGHLLKEVASGSFYRYLGISSPGLPAPVSGG